MTEYQKCVLFEREGDTPEVGLLINPGVVEFIDGTRVEVQDGDFLDPIDRSAETWDQEGLIALARGLEARTKRRLRQMGLVA